MTEKEKKDAGLWYMPGFDGSTRSSIMEANERCFEINQISPLEMQKRHERFDQLFSAFGKHSTVLSLFQCDYGYNIEIGDYVFINHNVYLMDCAPIHIGNHVLIGPSCGIYTATHAILAEERNKGLEKADAITIEDNVWIGGDVTILGGTTIGEGSIIGAKSLVISDIPKGVIAAGNPCKVIREITEEDRLDKEITSYYFK